jgi:hypothetical protein
MHPGVPRRLHMQVADEAQTAPSDPVRVRGRHQVLQR